MFKKDSKGKVRQWECSIQEKDEKVLLCVESGLVDGKKATTYKEVSPKNVGRANETTAMEQAEKEMAALRQKKYDKGYRETLDEIDDVPNLPMLAHKFEDRSKDITYPALIQPKLNGVRCLVTRVGEEIVYLSRGGKKYTTLDHMTSAFLKLLEDGATIDGEIYVFGWPLQRISSAVKKYNEDTEHLRFFAYDLAMPDVDCETRQAILANTLNDPKWLLTPILHTYTDIVHSEEEVGVYVKAFIDEGFEGGMVRNTAGGYTFNFRSINLQKVKFMQEEEFEIVGYEKELVYPIVDGRQSTTAYRAVIWTCQTPSKTGGQNGNGTFNVRPKGTREDRIAWFKVAEQQVGKNLTVQFQEYSEDMIPIFPVGIAVRDYE